MKILVTILLALAAPQFQREPLFLLHSIDRQNSESIALVDMDGDGLLDVTSGAYWYKSPDWTRTEYLETRVAGQPVSNCAELIMDVNRDGLPDLIAANWGAAGIWYYQNPGKQGVRWTAVKIIDTKDFEGMIAVDVDGDGQLDILPSLWSDQPVYWIRVSDGKFTVRPVAQKGERHGVGFEDVDGDGKRDILKPDGWFRQIDIARDQWEWHPDWHMEEASIPILAYDVNGDGRMDIIYGEAHHYGLFWIEQRVVSGRRTWQTRVIDPNYSQIHVVGLVDLNGDGKPEIFAGKRYRAHNDFDPGAWDPISVNYYSITPGAEPRFERFPLAYNAIAGVGTQCAFADLDKDGDVDIVCGGKTGQYWWENLRVNSIDFRKRETLFKSYPPRL